jgi:hypothetical protein
MAIKLRNVPLVAQENLNDCWIASFRMIERWYKILPERPTISRKKLESLVGGPNVLNSDKISALAKMTGMTEVQGAVPADLEKLLRTYGPLWYPAINKGGHHTSTGGHVVVIIGIDGDELNFHDPFPPKLGMEDQLFPSAEFFGPYLPPVKTPSPFLVMLKNSQPIP